MEVCSRPSNVHQNCTEKTTAKTIHAKERDEGLGRQSGRRNQILSINNLRINQYESSSPNPEGTICGHLSDEERERGRCLPV
ncbi:Hypothetical predicted protein [Xyrichtys novacula]|uniref:Uncharacterized protein n=1 Tax=Xyrichtys novacula TaxID=13765 RepID=A0AAV1G1K9_XYRNO|nr:Hypothetical predicted protein [Xyrichtys novacula]